MGEKLNGLTPDEFRNILSENLRKKGFINNLKVKIRTITFIFQKFYKFTKIIKISVCTRAKYEAV